jgi:NADH-quinone oxidoreductase subunit N
MNGLTEKIEWIQLSVGYLLPELILTLGIVTLLISSLFLKDGNKKNMADWLALVIFSSALAASILFYTSSGSSSIPLFNGMLQYDAFSNYFKILFSSAGVLTVLLSWSVLHHRKPEYYVLIFSAVLGAHLLVSSNHFTLVFLSIELISLPSYLLAAFAFNKKSMEAALKYFLFGSAASAVMLYGISLLYGLTQTLDFTTREFADALLRNQSNFLLITICLIVAGFLYKITSAPMHPWAPDVYEAAPIPVVAFFSVVPKLAGIGILTKFCLAITISGQSLIKWQVLIALIAITTLTIGNFAALVQKNPKRMMAYSSIAQAGFLLIGAIVLDQQGIQFMLFYATVFVVANFLVFYYLHYFEKRAVTEIAGFAGIGRSQSTASVLLLMGLISLTGLPPMGGFMGKLFVFTSLWSGYEVSQRSMLLALFIVGLLNTIVSLFYYLKIPYEAFLTSGNTMPKEKIWISENLLGIVLVVLLLGLFFFPSILTGWLNRITFAL